MDKIFIRMLVSYGPVFAYVMLSAPLNSFIWGIVTLTRDVEDGFEEAFAAVGQVSDLGVGVQSELRWTFSWQLFVRVVEEPLSVNSATRTSYDSVDVSQGDQHSSTERTSSRVHNAAKHRTTVCQGRTISMGAQILAS